MLMPIPSLMQLLKAVAYYAVFYDLVGLTLFSVSFKQALPAARTDRKLAKMSIFTYPKKLFLKKFNMMK